MKILGKDFEQRSHNGSRVDAVRFEIEGGITGDEIEQLKQDNPGYTEVLEHYLTLFVPPVDVEEVVAEKEAVQALLTTVAEALPDELAVQHPEIYPEWDDLVKAGKPVQADKRFRFEDGLYRVQQEHTPQAHHPPSVHTAALYTRIQNEETGPEEWQNGQSYAKGVEVIKEGWVWLSGVDNNVYEPGGEGVHDHIWKKVREA